MENIDLEQPNPTPGRHRFRRRVAVVGVAALFAGALGVVLCWRSRSPALPAIDLDGADPQVAAAILKVREEVSNSPRSAAAWGKLGMVLLAHDYRSEATACFVRAEKFDPNDQRWPYLQAWDYRTSVPEAIPLLTRAVQLSGDKSVWPRLRLAETLLLAGEIDPAEFQFRRILIQSKDNPWANLGLAKVARSRGQWQVVLKNLEPAPVRELLPKSFHTYRSEAYRRLGDIDASTAESRLAQAAADRPPPDPIAEKLASFWVGESKKLQAATDLIKRNQVPEAASMLRQLVQEYPTSNWSWLLLGQALLHLRDLPGAQAALEKANALAPDRAEPYFYFGLISMEQGDFKNGIRRLQQATEHNPEYGMAYLMMARCHQHEQDWSAAKRALLAALRTAPQLEEAHLRMAEILTREDKRAEATVYLKNAARINPANVTTRRMLEKFEASGGSP